jgi:hypothetical protein
VPRYAIKIDLNYVEWEGVAWIHLAQEYGQLAGSFEHGYELLGSIKMGEILN